jgi:hypothetical protein
MAPSTDTSTSTIIFLIDYCAYAFVVTKIKILLVKPSASPSPPDSVDTQSAVAHQQKQIEALTAGLQKVSAQLEASKPAPQWLTIPKAANRDR